MAVIRSRRCWALASGSALRPQQTNKMWRKIYRAQRECMRRGLLISFSRFKIQKFLGPIQRSTIKNSHDAYILLCAVYFSLRAKGCSQYAPTGNSNRAFSIERFFLLCADFRLCCPCFAAWGWLIKDVKCDISSLILLRRIHGNDFRRGEVDRGSHSESPMLALASGSALRSQQSN